MNTLSPWTRPDPFAEFDRFFTAPVRTAAFTPAAEVVRDGDDALVRLEVPGVDVAKDVTVEVDRAERGSRLVVRGERRDERAEERSGRTLREVRYGSFARSFGLPAHVSAEDVSASYDAGVLTVRVAGAHAAPTTATQIPVTRMPVTTDPAVEQPAA